MVKGSFKYLPVVVKLECKPDAGYADCSYSIHAIVSISNQCLIKIYARLRDDAWSITCEQMPVSNQCVSYYTILLSSGCGLQIMVTMVISEPISCRFKIFQEKKKQPWLTFQSIPYTLFPLQPPHYCANKSINIPMIFTQKFLWLRLKNRARYCKGVNYFLRQCIYYGPTLETGGSQQHPKHKWL